MYLGGAIFHFSWRRGIVLGEGNYYWGAAVDFSREQSIFFGEFLGKIFPSIQVLILDAFFFLL